MDEREAAWRALHDPATDAASLAQIAATHPEFAERIAGHPNCYPELKAWALATAETAVPAMPSTPAFAVSSTTPPMRDPVALSRRRLIIALVTAGAVAVAGGTWTLITAGSGSDAARGGAEVPSPGSTASTRAPEPATPSSAPTPAVTSVSLRTKPSSTGAGIVIEPTDDYDRSQIVLYSARVPQGVSISIGVRTNEKLRDVYWAVESDPDAPPIAVAIVFVSTVASGLNGTPDRLELRTYDATGALLSTETAEGLTGIPAGFDGWFRDGAADTAAVVNGTLLIATRSQQEKWVVAGVSPSTGTQSWTISSDDDLDAGFEIAPKQKLALFVRRGTLYALDAASGTVVWQTDGANYGLETFASAPFFHIDLAAASVGTLPGDFRTAATGLPLALPSGYQSWAVDQISGRIALTWSSQGDGDYPDSGPGFLVTDANGSPVFTLTANQARSVGRITVLGAYDNRVWIENSSGIDIVNSTTGERDPIVTATGSSVVWIPVDGNRMWTLLSTGGSSSAEYRLVMHPEGPAALRQLDLFSPH